MPATYDTDKLRSSSLCRILDFDPDSGSEVLVTLDPGNGEKCIRVQPFRRYLFGIMKSVGTGAITGARIIAATNAAGTGSPTTVRAHALATAPDAVGDTIWLECDADQIHEVLATGTYVGLAITLATSTDECVVSLKCTEAGQSADAVTADYISS
jgi:hypothetical protein